MRDSSHECADFYLIFGIVFWGSHDNVDGRLWTLACSATISTRIHLRSAPPLGHSIPLSLSNELCHVFHLVKQPDTAIISPSPSPSLIVHLSSNPKHYHPLYSYSSRIITRCRLFFMLLFIITFSSFRRSFTSLAFWEPYFLYALASSNLIHAQQTIHTFFRNFTRTHILPPLRLTSMTETNKTDSALAPLRRVWALSGGYGSFV
jgi:hypothetical protein